MIVHQLVTRGISDAFPVEVSIDFDALGEGIIAFVGENLSGKSHLLELSGPGTTHRWLPSYDEPLHAHVDPDGGPAHSELTFSLGEHRYRLKVQIDPSGSSAKTEAWLWRDCAEKPVAGEKVTLVDRELAGIMPNLELFLASNFACQSREGSLTRIKKADKKRLFIRMLGLERLQQMAKVAGGHESAALQKLDGLRREITAAEGRAARAAEIERLLAEGRVEIEHLEGVRAQVVAERNTAAEALTAAREALAAAEALARAAVERRAQLAGEITQAEADLAAATETVAALAATLAEAPAIRSAAARLAEVDARLAQLAADVERARAELAPLDTEAAEISGRLEGLLAEHARLKAESETIAAAAARVEAAGDLDAQLAEARAAHEAIAADVAQREAALPALEAADAAEQREVLERATKRARLTSDAEAAAAAASRITAAGDVEGTLARARESHGAIAADVAAREAALPALEAAQDAEAAAATTRAALLARRQDLEPRTGLLAQIDVTHEMCAVCPLTADARQVAESIELIDAELATLPAHAGASEALRTARRELAEAQRRQTEAARALADAEAAEVALRTDRESAARAPEIAAALAALEQEAAAPSTSAAETLRTARRELAEAQRQQTEAALAVAEAEAAAIAVRADREQAGRAAEVAAALDANVNQGKAARTRQTELQAQRSAVQARLESAVSERDQLAGERAPLVPIAGRLVAVQAAEAQVDSARIAVQRLTDRLTALRTERDAIAERDLSTERQALEGAAASSTKLEERLTEIHGDLQPRLSAQERLVGEQTALGDAAGALGALRTQETALAIEAADWAHLARAFGPDGIQALEISAAGPAVTALANDLLSTCFHGRWQVRIDTVEEAKSQRGKMKEIFDVVIIDGKTGKVRKKTSGGGMVVVDIAMRLALSIYNGRRSGNALRTLWLDEMDGALSEKNSTRYVQMLRRARELGGYWQILMVTHSPKVWAQADARLYVGGGRVSTTPLEDVAQEAA